MDFYRENGVSPGGDLFVVGGRAVERAGEHAALLLRIGDEDGPLVDVVVVVLPPGSGEAERDAVARGWRERQAWARADLGDDGARDELPRVVRLVVARSLEVEAVAEVVSRGRSRVAFVVPGAARYRTPMPLPDVVEATEDVWAPQLSRLAEIAVSAAHAVGAYVTLEADEWWPERESNRALLLGVDHCGVASAPLDRTRLADLRRDSLAWRGMAEAGDVAAARSAIKAAPNLSAGHRLFERMQVLEAGGRPDEVIEAFASERDVIDALSAEMRVAFAEVALSVGLEDVAGGLLRDALVGLQTVEAMQTALRTATGLDDGSLEAAVEAMLRERFPRSALLLRRDAERLVREGRHADAAAMLEGAVETELLGEAAFQRWLAERLGAGPGEADPFMTEARSRWPGRESWALRALAGAHERAGGRGSALDLLLAGPDGEGATDRASLLAALATIRRGVLARDPSFDAAAAVAVVEAGALWLARHPGDGPVRLRLVDLLSPAVLGATTALAVVSSVVTSFGTRHVRLVPHVPVAERARACELDLLVPLMRSTLGRSPERPTFALGRLYVDRGDLPASPEALVAGLVRLIEHAGEVFAGEDDERALGIALLLAVAIAPLGSEPDQDLVALRAAAGRLAQFGRAQRARDIAEHVLTVAGAEPRRIRLAWHAYADIYARAGMHVEALLGLAVALATGDEVDWEQIWHESYLGVRLMRDVGLLPVAEPMLARAREALGEVDPAGRFSHWLDTAELQLRLLGLERDGIDQPAADGLIERAASNLRKVVDVSEDPTPATSLLSSLIGAAREAGLEVRAEAVEALARGRSLLGAAAGALVAITADASPGAETLGAFAAGLETARHPDDVGYDLRHLAMGAERLLGGGLAGDPARAAWAIEAMADHGVRDADGGHGPRGMLSGPGGPAGLARDIAAAGVPVVMLGAGRNGLTRVLFESGRDEAVVECDDVFSPTAFAAWRDRYPRAYQDPERDTSHDFFTSTERLGVSRLPDRAVVVASTELQAFPPNLLQVERAMAGESRRLAAAPSLGWLAAAWRVPWPGDGRMAAWIPHPPMEERVTTLGVLAERLNEDFRRYGVETSFEAEPPLTLAGADLVVVAAHGGIGEDDRFFRVLEDDDHALMEPSALARALARAGIVVLFVCSGGRVDKHPAASATVGMVRRLLGNGCRAVVAPPWPLNTAVPPRWLPTFLDRWAGGAAVVDACFEANAAVRARCGYLPVDDLAMAVYGDPLAARPSPGSEGS